MVLEKLREKISEFEEFSSPEEKFELLLDYADSFESFDVQFKIDKYLVKGCTSLAYIKVDVLNDKVFLSGDGDALLVKGFLQVLKESLNGESVQTILDLDASSFQAFGLSDSTTQSRANAVVNLLNKIKAQINEQLKTR